MQSNNDWKETSYYVPALILYSDATQAGQEAKKLILADPASKKLWLQLYQNGLVPASKLQGNQ